MLTLESRIVETGIGIYGTPPRLHCGLPAHPLLFHLERRDRETPNLILWLLGSSHTRSIEHGNHCSQSCRSHHCDLLFHSRSLSNLWLCQMTSPTIPIPGVGAPATSL